MTIWATQHEDGITIDHVDEEVWFSWEMLGCADPRYLKHEGDQILIEGDNGSWVYEITGSDETRRSSRAKLVKAIRHSA